MYIVVKYPDQAPLFEYKHVKGITDEDLAKIKQEVQHIANNNIGNQMLYEIIQVFYLARSKGIEIILISLNISSLLKKSCPILGTYPNAPCVQFVWMIWATLQIA